MTRPRSQLVSLEATPYYHCIARCVRRSFLCGKDAYTGKNFDHRKPWLIDRLAFLTDIFAIDIAAFAVMSNHYHLVIHIDQARADSWTDDDVIYRWTKLYHGPGIMQQYIAGVPLNTDEQTRLQELIRLTRRKLCNISKFMACLNEYIARKANLEDGCTGRFWEGRFKSQALLDEAALLSCMAYVDLNPIRAGIAKSIASSDYTSAQIRLAQVRGKQHKSARKSMPKGFNPPRLMPFRESLRERDAFKAIPFNLKDYLDLVDWTGRSVRADKKGHIPQTIPQLVESLEISESQWRTLALEIQKQSITMLNGLETLAPIEKKAAGKKSA